MDRLPLDGVRIVDFTWAVAGPHCTRLLADMGAEAIKIESNARIDGMRYIGPFPADVGFGWNRAGAFNIFNRNKLGITLDLTKSEGVKLAKELVKMSDIVVNNFSPDVMGKLGLDYPALKKVKSDIIYAGSSGWGNSGPEKQYAGYAINLSYLSGAASVTGYLDDGLPRNLGTQYNDIVAGVQLAFAILAALHHRFQTGEGQEIDVSMWESATALLPETIMDYVMNGRIQSVAENREGIMAPCGCYRCKGEDRWVAIAISTEREWESLCHVMGRPDWTKEERFSNSLKRLENRDDLDELVEEWTSGYHHIDVMHKLQEDGIPAGASLTSEDLISDPHMKKRDNWVRIKHPEVGKHIVTGIIWKLSETPGKIRRHAPMVGEHNEYVFGKILGMTKKQIAKLVEKQIIY